jgi:DNA-binding IclR family transcriptional regulator
MRKKKSTPTRVGVIGKVLRILELLHRSPSGLELKDVAKRTGINKTTAHRFLSHLEAESYLLRDAGGAFVLGPKIARLGGGMSFEATLCKISRPTLENLRKTTGETVNLAVLEGSDILYLDVLESPHRFSVVPHIGAHSPVYCTALGKAILASMNDEQKKEQILASISFETNTPHTLSSISKLKQDLSRIRQLGFSHDDEESFVGARCIGAAILAADGTVAAAVSISGPTSRVTKERLPFYSGQIRQAAQDISWALGSRARTVKEDRVPQKSVRKATR